MLATFASTRTPTRSWSRRSAPSPTSSTWAASAATGTARRRPSEPFVFSLMGYRLPRLLRPTVHPLSPVRQLERRMTAFNTVRFRVKAGRDQEFLDAHKAILEEWPGLRRASIVKTGEQ